MEKLDRPEIHAFILASETFLSPVLMEQPLTEEERNLIKVYMKSSEPVVGDRRGVTEPARPVF